MNTKYVVLTNQTPNNGSPLLICCHEVALKKKKKKGEKERKVYVIHMLMMNIKPDF